MKFMKLKLLLIKNVNKQKKFEFYFILYFFRSFKSPASGKENVRFPDSPDFENSLDFQTGRDVR